MYRRLVIALCLPLLLWHVQVEGQPIVPSFKDVDDTLANLDENPTITSDPARSVQEAPVLAPQSPISVPHSMAIGPVAEIEPETTPPMASVLASFPTASPSPRFVAQMNQEIRRCRRETRLPTCPWRRGFIVVSQGLMIATEVSDDICCCACHRVDNCQAIHYERREGRCVFHDGPITRDQRQGGSKRWLKE